MKVSQGIRYWQEYHNLDSKKTPKNRPVGPFKIDRPFRGKGPKLPHPEEVLFFLTLINQRTKPLTNRTRYSQITSFFNFVTLNLDTTFRNPCNNPMLKKLYRPQDQSAGTSSKRKW